MSDMVPLFFIFAAVVALAMWAPKQKKRQY